MKNYEIRLTRSNSPRPVKAASLKITEYGAAVFKDQGGYVIFAVPAGEYIWVTEIK